MKCVTIRLLVDEHRAAAMGRGLATTAQGEGYIGINVEPDILHSYKITAPDATEGTENRAPQESDPYLQGGPPCTCPPGVPGRARRPNPPGGVS